MTAPARPPGRPRRAFWLFAAAMAVAVLGGGGIVLLNRRAVRDYRAEQARVEAERAAALEAAKPAQGDPPDAAPGRTADAGR